MQGKVQEESSRASPAIALRKLNFISHEVYSALPLGGQAPLRRSLSLAEHPPNVGEGFPHTPFLHRLNS